MVNPNRIQENLKRSCTRRSKRNCETAHTHCHPQSSSNNHEDMSLQLVTVIDYTIVLYYPSALTISATIAFPGASGATCFCAATASSVLLQRSSVSFICALLTEDCEGRLALSFCPSLLAVMAKDFLSRGQTVSGAGLANVCLHPAGAALLLQQHHQVLQLLDSATEEAAVPRGPPRGPLIGELEFIVRHLQMPIKEYEENGLSRWRLGFIRVLLGGSDVWCRPNWASRVVAAAGSSAATAEALPELCGLLANCAAVLQMHQLLQDGLLQMLLRLLCSRDTLLETRLELWRLIAATATDTTSANLLQQQQLLPQLLLQDLQRQQMYYQQKLLCREEQQQQKQPQQTRHQQRLLNEMLMHLFRVVTVLVSAKETRDMILGSEELLVQLQNLYIHSDPTAQNEESNEVSLHLAAMLPVLPVSSLYPAALTTPRLMSKAGDRGPCREKPLPKFDRKETDRGDTLKVNEENDTAFVKTTTHAGYRIAGKRTASDSEADKQDTGGIEGAIQKEQQRNHTVPCREHNTTGKVVAKHIQAARLTANHEVGIVPARRVMPQLSSIAASVPLVTGGVREAWPL
ncbi:hypothetical protein cyc_03995 [Cyclospora cayetanensis]|uniref:Uncharacterized protein n=1 Tax=Cyclospora cayetanensis TaxID=88456 RepID=A0A1D3CRF0_9EIME|nr:hypothetical protein cyc_03995 [Cyclospora cayetanensis]